LQGNEPSVAVAPPALVSSAWAFVVSGSVLDGDTMSASDSDYTAIVKNLRTGEMFTETVDSSGYFAAAWTDLNRKAVLSIVECSCQPVIDIHAGQLVLQKRAGSLALLS
jgi:hypothetical protein